MPRLKAQTPLGNAIESVKLSCPARIIVNLKQARSADSLRVAMWLLLGVTVAAVLFARIRLLGLPLERDEGEYAYAGQLILQGIPPYKLAYNMKFPGTYDAYALIMSIFGQTTA